MSSKPQFTGFAYCPEIRRHHIFVELPTRLGEDVAIVEDTSDRETPVEKARIPLRYWTELQTSVAAHFNQRIKEHPDLKTCPKARFVRGKRIPLDLLLGRELLVLAWAVEPWTEDPDKDPVILHLPQALDAWLGMMPEERWTLYRLTNARAGHWRDLGNGWRKALRYGLCGNVGEEAPTGRPLRQKKKAA